MHKQKSHKAKVMRIIFLSIMILIFILILSSYIIIHSYINKLNLVKTQKELPLLPNFLLETGDVLQNEQGIQNSMEQDLEETPSVSLDSPEEEIRSINPIPL